MTLSAQALTKRYGGASGCEAVRKVNLELPAGEFVSIVGRSGSGKSTLLAMLGALTPPSAGRLLLDGADVWRLSETERALFRARHIGFVFQSSSLLPNLTALDNVALPALLGHTMGAEEAYIRASDLLARVGLADCAEAYPGNMSGGEQRRAAIARALINSPRLLLADEPTSDLDEDTEADIVELLENLHRSEGFGFVLVTHDLALAGRARRSFEMRQGVLAAADLPKADAPPRPAPRHRAPAIPVPARAPIRLGADLRRSLRAVALGAAAVFGAILLVDFAVAKYQETELREHGERLARLAEMALSTLQSEVQSVSDLGGGQYELTVHLWSTGDARPIYVMSPDMRAYVQVGKLWREVPLQPAQDNTVGVLKIEGQHIFHYLFEARLSGFTQLLPNYMHVRFSDTMLVSPRSAPQGDVFERKNNYYVYLKPSDVADETVLQRMKFAGKPPVWIPMPPH